MATNATKSRYDVFVSYSHRDSEWLEKELLPQLRKSRIKIFLDKEDLLPGEKWQNKINQGIIESASTLVVLTNSYLSGNSTKGELENILMQRTARNNEIFLLPILLEDIYIPSWLQHIQYIDFRDYELLSTIQKENKWKKVTSAIRKAARNNKENINGNSTSYQKSKEPTNSNIPSSEGYLLTESGDRLLTESGDPIMLEANRDRTLGEIDNLTIGQLDVQTFDNKEESLSKISQEVSREPRESAPFEPSAETEIGNQSKESNEKTLLPTETRENIGVNGKALSDTYSEKDLLGFADYVEALAQFIESKDTQKPITIGIDAPWGGGKSTLMRMLEKRLGPKQIQGKKEKQTDGFFNVWFNAWKYDEEESLWGALVLEILKQVGKNKQLGWKRRANIWLRLNQQRFEWDKLWADIGKSLGFVLILGLAGSIILFGLSLLLGLSLADTINIWLRHYTKVFAGFGLITLLYEATKDILSTFISPFNLGVTKYIKTPDYKSKVGFLGQFQEDFKVVIDAVTETGKWPLAVFIDDLDRCTPAKAASVIEAINLLLDSQHCIFILGMDTHILSMSIQAKYKDLQELFKEAEKPIGHSLGRHFLEKIVQINFRLPTPDKEHINSFIDIQLGNRTQQVINQPEEKIAESLIKAEQRAGKNLEEASQIVQEARPELATDIDEAEEEIQEISFEESITVRESTQFAAKYLNYNPRQIKRFINMYRLQALVAHQRGLLEQHEGIELKTLATWILISMCWPEFFDAAIQNHYFPERFDEISRKLRSNVPLEDKAIYLSNAPENIAKPEIKRLLEDTDFTFILGSLNLVAENVMRYMQIVQTVTPVRTPDGSL